jgi:hypothetical protein
MATSSVAAALALPELVAAVDEFNELFPGVQASKEHLQPLWDLLLRKVEPTGFFNAVATEACIVRLEVRSRRGRAKKVQDLYVVILGPMELGPIVNARAVVACKCFAANLDGLADGLAWGKQQAKRVREREFCERCRVDGIAPTKQLRARPLPFCASCAFEVSLGEPSEKRARTE